METRIVSRCDSHESSRSPTKYEKEHDEGFSRNEVAILPASGTSSRANPSANKFIRRNVH